MKTYAELGCIESEVMGLRFRSAFKDSSRARQSVKSSRLTTHRSSFSCRASLSIQLGVCV